MIPPASTPAPIRTKRPTLDARAGLAFCCLRSSRGLRAGRDALRELGWVDRGEAFVLRFRLVAALDVRLEAVVGRRAPPPELRERFGVLLLALRPRVAGC